MNRMIQKTAIISFVSLFLGIFLGRLIFGGANMTKEVTNESQSPVENYTCAMHPDITLPSQGMCPICGMQLVLASEGGNPSEVPTIEMSPRAMELADIHTMIVEEKRGKPSEIRLNGKVVVNESGVSVVSAHMAGRVEKLLVNYEGAAIKKGETLAHMYSPELVLAQKELLNAFAVRSAQPGLYEAARRKLKNFKLSDAEVDQLLNDEGSTESFPIISKSDGVVLKKNVNQGDYVQRGDELFELADFATVWVLLEVNEPDMDRIGIDDAISFQVPSLPGKTFHARISFIDPVIQTGTGVGHVRMEISNEQRLLKPEMLVFAVLESNGGGSTEQIVVPKSAVMWTGKRSLVYVKKTINGSLGFEMREVVLGSTYGDHYAISEGLKEGEEIAINGTFSIDAAAQLAGSPSMMGKKAMHKHENMHETEHKAAQQEMNLLPTRLSEFDPQLMAEWDAAIERYLSLKDALVADNFEQAKKESRLLLTAVRSIDMSSAGETYASFWKRNASEMMDLLQSMIGAASIGEARAAFKPLSSLMIGQVRVFSPSGHSLYLQHCPMADDFNGADWLSIEQNILNPYFGASMLTCGEVTEAL
jgi:Cu(I)/Ag(I) efflux system membrane fusion protein